MEAYLDNSATTQCFEEVRDIVVKTMMEDYGNPSAMHKKGVEAEQYVKDATEKIAKTLKVQEKEIYFTSGGTESDNCCAEEGGEDHEEPVTGRVNLECCIWDECLDRIVCKTL